MPKQSVGPVARSKNEEAGHVKNALSALTTDLKDPKVLWDPPFEDPEHRASYVSFAAKHQLAKAFSKLRFQDQNDLADKAAIQKFISVNERMRNFRIEDQLINSWEEETLGNFREEVYQFFHAEADSPLICGFYQIFNEGSLGAGFCIGSKVTDFYSKLFSSDLSTNTSGLYDAYERWVQLHPLWLEAEEARLTAGYTTVLTETNRIACVPKNVTISRTICVEPSLTLFGQLGIGQLIRNRLKRRFGIDVPTQQDVNRRLAYYASESGRLTTIDLESASDSIGTDLVKWAIPRDQLSWLKFFSCRKTRVPGHGEQELGMLCTQGNGFTFPLMTMLFSCMVRATYRTLGLTDLRSGLTWSVFGDDIIIDSRADRLLRRILAILGFQVNGSKSFSEGPFRESCGVDAYLGQPCRPFYVKGLGTQEERYTAINRAIEWSSTTGISVNHFVNYLLGTVKWRPIPFVGPPDGGIRCPLNLATGLKFDRNGTLQVHVRQAVARKLLVGGERVSVPRGEVTRIYNSAGLLISALHGCYRGEGIGIRSNRILYRTRRVPAPSWDGTRALAGGLPAWRRWVDAATRNIPRVV